MATPKPTPPTRPIGLRGFWKLTWIETKVFAREPLGLLGSLLVPVIIFVVARSVGSEVPDGITAAGTAPPGPVLNVAILAAIFIAIGTAVSLVAIISIYREGGILKRLRATPLSPLTILSAHVFVKLVFALIGLGLLVVAGRRLFPGALEVNLFSFGAALTLSTVSIISVGFVISSIVPTARFAQPLASAILYPTMAISGLFFPLEMLSAGWRAFANVLPTTHAVGLMQGVWDGAGWGGNLHHVAGLFAVIVVCSLVSTRTFRWE